MKRKDKFSVGVAAENPFSRRVDDQKVAIRIRNCDLGIVEYNIFTGKLINGIAGKEILEKRTFFVVPLAESMTRSPFLSVK